MELEDLKSKWQSVKPHIVIQLIDKTDIRNISKSIDAKSRLLKRSLWSQSVVAICIILMATSRMWSPLKLPYWWIGLFCTVMIYGIHCSIKDCRIIEMIDLCNDSNTKIMTTVLSLKRNYRNLELTVCVTVIPLLLWISLNPPIIYTWKMYQVWGLTLLALSLEYLWYKSNLKQFNKIVNWKNE